MHSNSRECMVELQPDVAGMLVSGKSRVTPSGLSGLVVENCVDPGRALLACPTVPHRRTATISTPILADGSGGRSGLAGCDATW
jgi:hypothetical protein